MPSAPRSPSAARQTSAPVRARARWSALKRTGKGAAVDGLAAGAVTLAKVAALDHKVLDDAVNRAGDKVQARIGDLANALLARAQRTKVFGGLGHLVRKQLKDDPARWCPRVHAHACRPRQRVNARWRASARRVPRCSVPRFPSMSKSMNTNGWAAFSAGALAAIVPARSAQPSSCPTTECACAARSSASLPLCFPELDVCRFVPLYAASLFCLSLSLFLFSQLNSLSLSLFLFSQLNSLSLSSSVSLPLRPSASLAGHARR